MRILERLLSCIFGVEHGTQTRWTTRQLYEDKYITDHLFIDCFCKATHNSYLTGLQIIGPASLDTFIKQLHDGVRCLELDIFKHIDSRQLVLAHGDVRKGIQATSYVYLDSVLALIQKYAWRGTTLPLVLFTEFQILDETLYPEIDKLFRSYFGTRIHKKLVGTETLYDLRGKVLIYCTNAHFKYGVMQDYINPSVYNNIPSTRLDLTHISTSTLTRVYPKNKVLSTNYDITPFTRHGCQIISINYQTSDHRYSKLFPEGYGFIPRNVFFELNETLEEEDEDSLKLNDVNPSCQGFQK